MPTVPSPARPTFSGSAITRRQPGVERRPANAASRGERRCAAFPDRFQETAGYCGPPGGCAARSRPARCAHSPRRIRRSRRRARPRRRPSRPAASRIRRCRAVTNGSGIGAQANIEARGGGTCQPARPNEFDQRVAPAPVDRAHLVDALVGAVERRGRRDLDRREGAVIEIGFDPRQRGDEALVADGKADAPARHRIGLRHRGEFDRDVHRARHLQHRRRRIVVEIDLGISEIGQHQERVLLRERDEVAIEVEIGDAGGRVRRIADHDRDRLRDRMQHRALERAEEARVRRDRHRADGAAGHQEAEDVDRIGRIGHDDDVARRRDRLGDIGEAFLRAERGDDLGLGIELHAEAARIIGGLGAAQPRYSLGRRIAVGARLADGLLELLDDMRRRRQIGIAHAEIDDVGAAVARPRLGAIDLLEHVRRQPADAIKVFHDSPGAVVSRRSPNGMRTFITAWCRHQRSACCPPRGGAGPAAQASSSSCAAAGLAVGTVSAARVSALDWRSARRCSAGCAR